MCMLIAKFSSQAHELMLQFFGSRSGRRSFGLLQVLSQPLQAQCSPNPGIMPQGSREGTSALSECETFGCGVQVRPTTWCGAVRVGYDEPGPGVRSFSALRVRPCDDPQQLTLGGPLPAADAGPDGTGRARRLVELGNHRRTVYRGGAANPNSVIVVPRREGSPEPATPPAGAGRPVPRRSGCRSASRSSGRRDERSGPPCRWRARAGSRAPRRGPSGWPRRPP
jgi:hypothetical protein